MINIQSYNPHRQKCSLGSQKIFLEGKEVLKLNYLGTTGIGCNFPLGSGSGLEAVASSEDEAMDRQSLREGFLFREPSGAGYPHSNRKPGAVCGRMPRSEQPVGHVILCALRLGVISIVLGGHLHRTVSQKDLAQLDLDWSGSRLSSPLSGPSSTRAVTWEMILLPSTPG